MAQIQINIGTTPNDGSGDTLRSAFSKTQTNFSDLYIGAGTPGIFIPESTSNFATDLQTANNTLREAGGGFIILQANAVYTLGASVTIDIGAGVGIHGNGAWIVTSIATANTSAIVLSSTPPTNPAVASHDGSTTNYHQQRVSIEGFSMVGPGKGTSTLAALDINLLTSISTTRSPRASIRNVNIDGFYQGIRHRNNAYLIHLNEVNIFNCDRGLSLEGGINQGECTTFISSVIANCTNGIYIDTKPETGSDTKFDVSMFGVSLDYNDIFINFVTGYGLINFHSCHFEHNNITNLYPFSLLGDNANRAQFNFLDSYFLFTNATLTGFNNYFYIGQNTRVRVRGCQFHNVVGLGQIANATGSPTGTPTYFTSVAYQPTSSSEFLISESTWYVSTQNPACSSVATSNNWLADGGFENTTFQDLWWIYKDGGIIRTSGPRTTGTNIVSIATSAADKHTGSRSLAILMDANGALSSGSRVVALLCPKNGDIMSGQIVHKLSAGSGTFTFTVLGVKIDPFSSQWTSNTFSTLADTQFIPNITKTTSLYSSGALTPSTAGWTVRGIPSGNLPKLIIPEWCTHIMFQIDASSINNPSGVLYIDDAVICGW